jgi:hypothetical protein
MSQRRKDSAAPTPDKSSDRPADAHPVLKSHPKARLILGILFFAWIAFLIVLYFTTVFPQRHPQ